MSKLNIAIDYDDTYTASPSFWNKVKNLAQDYGHNVFCVTKRGEDHKGLVLLRGWNVFHTNLQAKKQYCKEAKIKVDIWIDDAPENIIYSGKIKK